MRASLFFHWFFLFIVYLTIVFHLICWLKAWWVKICGWLLSKVCRLLFRLFSYIFIFYPFCLSTFLLYIDNLVQRRTIVIFVLIKYRFVLNFIILRNIDFFSLLSRRRDQFSRTIFACVIDLIEVNWCAFGCVLIDVWSYLLLCFRIGLPGYNDWIVGR